MILKSYVKGIIVFLSFYFLSSGALAEDISSGLSIRERGNMTIIEENKESAEHKITKVEKRLVGLEERVRQIEKILDIEKSNTKPIALTSPAKEQGFLKYIEWDREYE